MLLFLKSALREEELDGWRQRCDVSVCSLTCTERKGVGLAGEERIGLTAFDLLAVLLSKTGSHALTNRARKATTLVDLVDCEVERGRLRAKLTALGHLQSAYKQQ